jgi:hypothetical protein
MINEWLEDQGHPSAQAGRGRKEFPGCLLELLEDGKN